MKLFGLRRTQTLLGCLLLTLNLGCNREPDTASVNGDVKTRIPVAQEGGGYSLKEVTLVGIDSLYEFSGRFANFYFSPSMSNGKITGFHPKTRFIKSGGLYIPADPLTQQVAVIYAHMQNFAALDKELGAEGINTWPRDVGVEVRYQQSSGSLEVNNAFYEGNTDSMLIVPFTSDQLPIGVNAGVLAHEYFHSLYFKIVEKKVFQERLAVHGQDVQRAVLRGTKMTTPEMDDENIHDAYHSYFSRGINEGLADFWGWIYTGDPDFMMASVPSEREARTLSISVAEERATPRFVTSDNWKNQVLNRENPGYCQGGRVAYCLGTQYARTLKRLAGVVQSSRGITSMAARKEVGKAIVKSLPMLRDSLLSLKDTEYFEPVKFFTFVQSNLQNITATEKTFLETMVQNTAAKKVEDLNPASSAQIKKIDKLPDQAKAKVKPAKRVRTATKTVGE